MGQVYTTQLDDPLIFDRVESFRGGMNSYVRATLLDPDTSADCENILIDTDHIAKTRPGTTVLGAAVLAASRIQGLAYFDTPSTELLVACCDSALQKWNGTAWSAVSGYVPTSDNVPVEMAQGNNLLYMADGTNPWHSYDGTTVTSLGTVAGLVASDPPVAAPIMCWHTHRMFAAGSSSEPDTVWASDILNAGTAAWDHTRFKFRVGGGEGDPIVMLASLHDFYLLVGKRNSLWLVYTDPAAVTAANWPITCITRQAGAVSRRAHCDYANDKLVLTTDGVYSVRRMQSQDQAYEVVPPISEPIQPLINRINWEYAEACCAARFKHFGLFSVPLDTATLPNTTFVFNFRTNSWCGYFTGWRPMIFATTQFADVPALTFGDKDGRVQKWRYNESDSITVYTDAGNEAAAATRISSRLKTRSMLFGDPTANKDGELVEVRFIESDGAATVAFIADEQEERTWTDSTQPVWNSLPVDLPFDLARNRPAMIRRSLIGIEPWNECCIEVRMSDGWMKIKNCGVGAFINTIVPE